MHKSLKIASVTLGVVLLLGALGVGMVFAQTPTPSATTTTATDWQSVFLGKVATILGVDQAKLTDAMKQAAREVENERIDKAVQDGRMTQEWADWLKQRPEKDGLNLRGFGFDGLRGHGGKFGGRMGGPNGVNPSAQATPAPTR